MLHILKGTADFGLFYKKSGNEKLVGFSDNDYARDLEDKKTHLVTFYANLGSYFMVFKETTICEFVYNGVEFIAAAFCACQAVWLRRILEELSCIQQRPTLIYCDNNLVIKLSKNPVMNGRNRYIDIQFYFLCDLTKE